MPSKPKAKAAPKDTRNAVQVVLRNKDDNPDDATARTLTRPEVQAAATIQKWEGDNQEVNALARELAAQVAAVNGGDLTRAEGMLIAQAHTLDALFNNLARRAHGQEYLLQYETYMRLALKTQSQCRATLETLAAIKNPPNVAFVRQANIASGPQQVNNGVSTEGGASRARETQNLQNKLLEAQHGERLDTGTTGTAQSELVRRWRPWESSTGPKSAEGKARVSRNADKGGTRQVMRELRRALRGQDEGRRRMI